MGDEKKDLEKDDEKGKDCGEKDKEEAGGQRQALATRERSGAITGVPPLAHNDDNYLSRRPPTHQLSWSGRRKIKRQRRPNLKQYLKEEHVSILFDVHFKGQHHFRRVLCALQESHPELFRVRHSLNALEMRDKPATIESGL